MDNVELLLRMPTKDVADEVIEKIKTPLEALLLCKSISGLNDQQISGELGIDPAQWSKIFNGGTANFPINKILCFMRVCQNLVPLRWLAMKCGYELKRIQSEVERENEELKAALKQERADREAVTRFFREAKP